MASAVPITRPTTADCAATEPQEHHSDIFPSVSGHAVLDAAARALEARWTAAATLAGEASQGVQAMSTLCDALRIGLAGGPLPSLVGHDWMADGPRLLTALRREVLARPVDAGAPATEVVRVVQQIERLSQRLEQDASAQFAEHVLGPRALQLLVEVAHDMRSPLTSIQLLVERMRAGHAGPVSPLQERQLGLVFAAAFGLSRMACDVTELAQGSARLVGPARVPFSISDVFHSVRDVVQPIAEEKRLTLRFSGPAADVRLGHPAALHRVLLNLVTNALKFTSSGGVTVQAEVAESDTVRFLVADTGRGMPAAVITRLRPEVAHDAIDGDGRPVFSSAGLGIAICQQLIGAMGATLRLVASDGYGTQLEFFLELPLVPAA